MKGTGFGSYKATIVIRVARKDIVTAQEKAGVEPEWRSGEECSVYFVLPLKVSRIADDETIMFELYHKLGSTFEWEVIWADSEY
jgi:hypothetical protein